MASQTIRLLKFGSILLILVLLLINILPVYQFQSQNSELNVKMLPLFWCSISKEINSLEKWIEHITSGKLQCFYWKTKRFK